MRGVERQNSLCKAEFLTQGVVCVSSEWPIVGFLAVSLEGCSDSFDKFSTFGICVRVFAVFLIKSSYRRQSAWERERKDLIKKTKMRRIWAKHWKRKGVIWELQATSALFCLSQVYGVLSITCCPLKIFLSVHLAIFITFSYRAPYDKLFELLLCVSHAHVTPPALELWL